MTREKDAVNQALDSWFKRGFEGDKPNKPTPPSKPSKPSRK